MKENKDMMNEAEEIKIEEMSEQELSDVAAGGWGYHDYHNKDAYKFTPGMKIDFTLNPFKKDKFTYEGTSVTSDTASALVFYFHSGQEKLGTAADTIQAALTYKANNLADYKADLKGYK